MEMFKVTLGNRKGEVSVRGVANLQAKTVKFQACINNIPFLESEDYEEMREIAINAVEINQTEIKEKQIKMM